MDVNDYYETYEQKWLCLFLIDVSASMGEDSLGKLYKELSDFHRLISEDAVSSARFELCITTFGQEFEVLQEPALVPNFTMPTIGVNETDLIAGAMKKAVEKIESRKFWYKETGQPFYRPCLVLVTPEASDKLYYSSSFVQFREDVEARRYDFLNLGMNGTSVLANKGNVSIQLKESRSLTQVVYSVFHCTNVDLDEPMYDHREDDVIGDIVSHPGWIDTFEI